MENKVNIPEIIILNVSGKIIKTSKETLLKLTYFNSILSRWNKDEEIFVDCDPDLFKKFLQFVRFDSPIDNNDFKTLCDYYGYAFNDYKNYKTVKVKKNNEYKIKKIESIIIKILGIWHNSSNDFNKSIKISIKLNDILFEMEGIFHNFFKRKLLYSHDFHNTNTIEDLYIYSLKEKYIDILNNNINHYDSKDNINKLSIIYNQDLDIFITYAEN